MERDPSDPILVDYPVDPDAPMDFDTERHYAKMAIDEIAKYDPTPNKKYINWMVKRYVDGGIRQWEDLSRTGEALRLFHQVKRQLPQNLRDINQYKELTRLENIVEPFVEQTTIKVKEKELVENEEVSFVLNTPKLKVVIPLSERASCYYGRNTVWCTAATRSHNYFEEYNREGPLYIIVDKKMNKRWQFHFPRDEYLDDSEQPINLFTFFKTYPELLKIQDFKDVFKFEGESLRILKHSKDIIQYIDSNGQNHRLNGPAFIRDLTGINRYSEHWMRHGIMFREDGGPSEIEIDGHSAVIRWWRGTSDHFGQGGNTALKTLGFTRSFNNWVIQDGGKVIGNKTDKEAKDLFDFYRYDYSQDF